MNRDASRRTRIPVGQERIVGSCRRWRIQEFALFGSVLRDDSRPDSDVDVLVTFEQGAPWNLLDFVSMSEELTAPFGRRVDLVEKTGLRKPLRRHTILTSRQVIPAA